MRQYLQRFVTTKTSHYHKHTGFSLKQQKFLSTKVQCISIQNNRIGLLCRTNVAQELEAGCKEHYTFYEKYYESILNVEGLL